MTSENLHVHVTLKKGQIFCLNSPYFLDVYVEVTDIGLPFLVSGRDLAGQQEVSLALTKTPPIYYYNVVDNAFSNYAGSELRI